MLDRLLKSLFFIISFGLMLFITIIMVGCAGSAPSRMSTMECKDAGGILWCERSQCECVSRQSAQDAMDRIFL